MQELNPSLAAWEAAGPGLGLGCLYEVWEVQEYGKAFTYLLLLLSSLPSSQSASLFLHLVTNISLDQALSSAEVWLM